MGGERGGLCRRREGQTLDQGHCFPVQTSKTLLSTGEMEIIRISLIFLNCQLTAKDVLSSKKQQPGSQYHAWLCGGHTNEYRVVLALKILSQD